MRHRDFARPLRDALRADVRALREGAGAYKYVHRAPPRADGAARWTATARTGANKLARLGTYAEPAAAALVRAAAARDAALLAPDHRERWLEAMRDDGLARAWVRAHAADGAEATALETLRRSPSLGRWRAHVRHLPGNAAYRDALASWNAVLLR